MPSELMERPMLQTAIGLHALKAGIRRYGTSRLLHISKILAAKEALELSDEQVQELRKIHTEVGHKLIKLTADVQTARFDSINTITSRPVNFEQLRTNAKNVSQLRLQRKLAVIDAFEKAAKVLSQEQKEQLSEFLSAWANEGPEEAHEAE